MVNVTIQNLRPKLKFLADKQTDRKTDRQEHKEIYKT